MSPAARIEPDVTLDEDLVADALALNIDISSAAADGIAKAVRAERERLWRMENAEAIAASNRYVAEHGLPLARYRQF